MAQTLEFMVTVRTRCIVPVVSSVSAMRLGAFPASRRYKPVRTTQHVLVTVDPSQVGAEQVRSKLEQLGYQAKIA
jgi:GTP-sensing pleiotropic transcriptional regulator CodY